MAKFWTRKKDNFCTTNVEKEKEEREVPSTTYDFAQYCKDLADQYDDETGDRCFPEMAEGQFVRGH